MRHSRLGVLSESGTPVNAESSWTFAFRLVSSRQDDCIDHQVSLCLYHKRPNKSPLGSLGSIKRGPLKRSTRLEGKKIKIKKRKKERGAFVRSDIPGSKEDRKDSAIDVTATQPG